MVLAKRIFVLLALFLCANAGIFDQDLRNVGSHSVELFERVSAMRVAEVNGIVRELWEMSERRLADIGSLVGKADDTVGKNVAEVRGIVQELLQMSERRLADIESLVGKADNTVGKNVADVRDIANQWWQMSLRDMEKMTSRVDNMVGGNVARMEKAAERVRKSVTMVPFLIFAYMMLYRFAERIGPWKATALGVGVALVVDSYLLDA